MAMLSKAKEASKKEEPKKKKHPPSGGVKQPAQDVQEPEAGEAEDQEPDAGSDQSEAQGSDEGAGASPDAQPQGGGDDQQQPQAGGGQAVGGQQGGAPVPDPNAPGAGDTTSGGADTPDDGDADDQPGQSGPAGTGSENSVPQVPISKGMQEEYQRVDAAIQQELYGPGPLAQHVLETLQPQGKAKIQSVVMMSVVLTRGMYKKFKFPIQLAAHIMHDIAGRVMEIGEQAKGIQYSDHDASLIIGAVMEGGMRLFGVSKGQVNNLVHHVGKSALLPHADKYHSTISVAKQALAAGGQGAPPQGAPAAGAQGAPPPAQPGAGPDQSAGEPGEDEAPQGGGEEE